MKALVVLAALVAFGCASRPCREPADRFVDSASADSAPRPAVPKGASSNVRPAPDATPLPGPATRVFVAKSNGSRQCEGGAIPLDRMAGELAPITIYSRTVQNDGLMRPQVCGAGTGAHNVYEIDSKDLPKAQSLGFRLWKK